MHFCLLDLNLRDMGPFLVFAVFNFDTIAVHIRFRHSEMNSFYLWPPNLQVYLFEAILLAVRLKSMMTQVAYYQKFPSFPCRVESQ